jgi:glycosyltransferase involved in cell wall biosynthesis
VVVHGRKGSSVPTDEFEMTALWRDASDLSLLELQQRILQDRSEVVILQFNFGFFNVVALADLVAALEAADVRVVVVMHSTQDVEREDFKASLRNGVAGLARASRILVHSVDDLNRLASMGLGSNAAFFPHGAMDIHTNGIVAARKRLEISPDVKVVATYGFMLPHKGLAELVDGFAEICAVRDDVYLFMVNALYPAEVSIQMQREIQAQVDARGVGSRVRMFTGFLPEPVSLALLEAANVVVFPYQETAESASGAVRFGLAARRPVATTPLRIFADLEGHGLRFSGCSANEIAGDLARWLEDGRAEAVVPGQNEWIRARSWPRLMLRLVDMCRGLLADSPVGTPIHSRNNPNR